jgi:hypothetical protein
VKLVYFACLLVLVASQQTPVYGQTAASPSGAEPAPRPTPVAKTESPTQLKLRRWLEVQTATITVRYRAIENSAGLTTSNSVQHQDVFRGRFKFDAQGNYSLNAVAATGNGFIASWADTGWGTGRPTSNLYLKQLYFSAQPIKGVELQYGGLPVIRGESTEITSYDNDGYLVGERLSLKRPQQFYFDEVSVTYAYLGDVNRSNLDKRYHRLKQSNYHQFLLSKNVGQRVTASVDYTFHAGVETLREGVKIKLPEVKLLDTLRWENYERLDVLPAYGFALTGEKRLSKRFTLSGGYAQIDRHYDGLNADRFNRGHRLFALGSYALSQELTASTFLTRAVGNDYTLPNRTRFEVLISFNLLRSLQRAGLL